MKKKLSIFTALILTLNLFVPVMQAGAAEEQETVTSRQLMVSGNKIVYADNPGTSVQLAGVNIPSLEWGSTGEHLNESLIESCDNWNANVIRLPVATKYWNNPEAYPDYRGLVDDMVRGVTSRGKYIILDCHSYVMPTQDVYDLWMSMAEIYGNNPAVLFGLCNEPHDIKGANDDASKTQWELWYGGGQITINSEVVTGIGHQPLVEAIRDKGAKNILIAAGLNWGYDLSGMVDGGFMLKDQGSNDDTSKTGYGIMYDSHIYPSKGLKASWDKAAGCVRSFAPLLIGESGWDSGDSNISNDTSVYNLWMPQLHDWIDDVDGTYGAPANWTAWCLHPNASPRLLSNGWTYQTTYFNGKYVKERLQSYDDTRSVYDAVYTFDSFRETPKQLFNGSKKKVSVTLADGTTAISLLRGDDSTYVGAGLNIPIDKSLVGVQTLEFDVTADEKAVSTGMQIEAGFVGTDTEIWAADAGAVSAGTIHMSVDIDELKCLTGPLGDGEFTYGINSIYIGAANTCEGVINVSNITVITKKNPTISMPEPCVTETEAHPSHIIDFDSETPFASVKNDNGPGAASGDFFNGQYEAESGYDGTGGLHVQYGRIYGMWGGYFQGNLPSALDCANVKYFSFMMKGNGDAQTMVLRTSSVSATVTLSEGDTEWHQYVFPVNEIGGLEMGDISYIQVHANSKIESEVWIDNIQLTEEYPRIFVGPAKVLYENGFEDTLMTCTAVDGSAGSTVTGKISDGGYNSQCAYKMTFNNAGDEGAAVQFRSTVWSNADGAMRITFDAKTDGAAKTAEIALIDKVGAVTEPITINIDGNYKRFIMNISDFYLNDAAILSKRTVGTQVKLNGSGTMYIDNISFSNYEVPEPVANSANYINTFDEDVYGSYDVVCTNEASSFTAEVAEGAGYNGTKALSIKTNGTQTGTTTYVDITKLPSDWDFSKVKYVGAMVQGTNERVGTGYEINGSRYNIEMYYDDSNGNSIKTGSFTIDAAKNTWSNVIAPVIPNTNATDEQIKATNRLRIYSAKKLGNNLIGGIIIDDLGFYDMKPEHITAEGEPYFIEAFDHSSYRDLDFKGGYYNSSSDYLWLTDWNAKSHWGFSAQVQHSNEGSSDGYASAKLPLSWELERTTHITFDVRLQANWRTLNYSTEYDALPEEGLTKTNITFELLDGDGNKYAKTVLITNKGWDNFEIPLTEFKNSEENTVEIVLSDIEEIRVYCPDAGQSGFNMDNLGFKYIDPTATPTPTAAPTATPTAAPTATPTVAPTIAPTAAPTDEPSEPTDPAVSVNWTGTGTQDDPYVITDYNGLTDLRDNVNTQVSDYEGKYFALDTDITDGTQFGTGIGFKGTTSVNGVKLTDSVFKGNFDGRNHIVILSAASNGNDSSAGLFGYAAGGTIENIIFGDPTGETATNISVPSRGGMIGYGENLTVRNCVNYTSVSSKTTSSGYGGIAGTLKGGSITGCTNYAEIKGYGTNGGIVGSATDVDISDCENYGTISPTSSGAAGIAGNIAASSSENRITIKNCTNYGSIIAPSDKTLSGFAGISGITQYADYINCVNNADISCQIGRAGGIIAELKNSTLTNSINNGNVTAPRYESVGGLVGQVTGSADYPSTVTNCINNGNVTSNIRWVGGCFGTLGSYCTAVHCINNGEVKSLYSADDTDTYSGYIGGISGACGGFLYECYNTGKITGYSGDTNNTAGGITGSLSGKMYDCINFGECNFGGVVGRTSQNSAIYSSVNLGTSYYAAVGTVGGWMPACKTYYNSDINYADMTNGTGYTTEQFKDGTVLALLNGTKNQHYNDAAEVWRQGAEYPELIYFAASLPDATSAEIISATTSQVDFKVTLSAEDAELDPVVIIALYDDNGSLVEMAVSSADAETVTFTNGANAVKAKLFVWTAGTNIPITDRAEEFNIYVNE